MMSERIYNTTRKLTSEGEDKTQIPAVGHPATVNDNDGS
jgi:hypothetical protein